VQVVCPPPYYPHWRVQSGYSALEYQTESIEGVSVLRCPLYVPEQPTAIKRFLYGISFALSSLPVMLRMVFWRPDVVYVIEPSFLNSFNALMSAWLSGAKSWLQIQDFEIDIALNMGMAKSGLVARIARTVESIVMNRFDVVSTISGRMLDHLKSKRVSPARCRLFRNWVDTNVIFPQEYSPMRVSLGIRPEKIVCLFSGTMGAKQGVEIIVEAARILAARSHPNHDLEFVICGDGGAKPTLIELAAGMPQVRFLPLQPLSALNDLLSVADIHLLPQKPTAQDLVMPSKLLGMTASGRPVIATVNAGTEVADSLATFGIVTPPGDASAFAAAIESLAANQSERHRLGQAARDYAIHNLSKQSILAGFELALFELSGQQSKKEENHTNWKSTT
jgi:colanic acid biosynthesis glycosyl transferase WcaI